MEETMGTRKRVSVIGAGTCGRDTAELAEAGFDVVCGGLGGVMEAASKGASGAGARVLGILPGLDVEAANPFVTDPVATGLGQMRNALVVLNGEIAVAVEGEYGTLSEIALALKSGKTVVALGRYGRMDGVIGVESPERAVELVKKRLG